MSLASCSVPKRSNFFDWAFAFLLLFAIATNLVWFMTDNHILGDSTQNHLILSVDFYRGFSSVINGTLPLLEKITAAIRECGRFTDINTSIDWPQGFNLSAYVFYLIAGTTLFAARLNLLPYLFILLLSTYCIGKHIDSRPAGLVAAFSLFFYPIIFQSSRQYQLDFPLTAMVALNVLFLLRSDQFRSTKFSLLFGVASGWAMLIKGQYVIFMIMPLSYVLYGMFRESWREIFCRPFRSRQLLNIVLALTLFVPIAMIWWGPRLSAILNVLSNSLFNPVKNLEPTPFSWAEKFSLECITFQIRSLFYSSLRPFFSALFFIALPVFLWQKTKMKLFLFFWALFPIFFFSFLVTLKHTRFLMPMLPAMALITAVGLCHIKSRILKILIFVSMTVIAVFQFYILSYANHFPDMNALRGFSLLGKQGFGSDYETNRAPHNHTFKINEAFDMVDDVVKSIEAASPAQNPVIFLIKSGPSQDISDLQWVYRMLLRHPAFKFFLVESLNPDSGPFLDTIDFVVCYYSGSARATPETSATTGLETLLRSSEKWDSFVESLWKLKTPDQWANFLKVLVRYNDQFERVLYQVNKDHTVAICVYKRKR